MYQAATKAKTITFMPPERNSGTSSFCPVCGKKLLTLARTFNHMHKRCRLHIWYVYSINETLLK